MRIKKCTLTLKVDDEEAGEFIFWSDHEFSAAGLQLAVMQSRFWGKAKILIGDPHKYIEPFIKAVESNPLFRPGRCACCFAPPEHPIHYEWRRI